MRNRAEPLELRTGFDPDEKMLLPVFFSEGASEDAVWELPHLDMEGITGRDNIIAAWLQAMELFPFVNMMAHPGYISVSGDRATMRSYTSEVAVMQDGTQIEPRGEYEDECVRVDGEWRFSLRRFRVLHGE